MKIALCIIAGIAVCLHAFAAVVQMRKNQSRANDMLMIAGAVIAAVGVILCLAGNGADWPAALAGFALIAYAAIQNGRKNRNFHIQHHIIRIAVFAVLTVGFFAM